MLKTFSRICIFLYFSSLLPTVSCKITDSNQAKKTPILKKIIINAPVETLYLEDVTSLNVPIQLVATGYYSDGSIQGITPYVVWSKSGEGEINNAGQYSAITTPQDGQTSVSPPKAGDVDIWAEKGKIRSNYLTISILASSAPLNATGIDFLDNSQGNTHELRVKGYDEYGIEKFYLTDKTEEPSRDDPHWIKIEKTNNFQKTINFSFKCGTISNPDNTGKGGQSLFLWVVNSKNDIAKFQTSAGSIIKTSAWEISTVNPALVQGDNFTSLTVDPENFVHISYYENNTLKYSNNLSGSWIIQPIEDNLSLNFGPQIKMDLDKSLHIAYVDAVKKQIRDYQKENDLWSSKSITDVDKIGGDPDFIIDKTGNFHFLYNDIDGSLHYLNIDPVKQSSDDVIIESSIISSSLTTDSQGKVYIVYYNQVRRSIEYTAKNKEEWEKNIIDQDSEYEKNISIKVDSQDRIHIGYIQKGLNGGLKYAFCTTGKEKKCNLKILDPAAVQFINLVTDKNGNAHIVYYDLEGKILKYTNTKDIEGQWNTCVIDREYDVGAYASLEIDSADILHVSYRDSTNGYLKYAKKLIPTN